MKNNNTADYKVYEETIAEIDSQTPPTDAEVLAAFIPAALRDGALLIELKETRGSDIKNAVILTLHEEQCPISSQPETDNAIESIWCWNMRQNSWYKLKFADIDAAQPFPPIIDNEL